MIHYSSGDQVGWKKIKSICCSCRYIIIVTALLEYFDLGSLYVALNFF